MRRATFVRLLTPDVESPVMPNTNERAVLTDVTEGIGTVTLNKPWKLNAWDTPMRAEIAEVLRGWNADARVHAVVMTGAGDRAFSAGQDLDETEKFQSGTTARTGSSRGATSTIPSAVWTSRAWRH